jgi:Fic family protein
MNILKRLLEEKQAQLRGGLYHETQIKICYNSNRIEGSRLSEEQTRYIFETNTIDIPSGEAANIDDIIETVNHFAAFDYLLDVAVSPLSEGIIQEFHRILKTATTDSRKEWFQVGGYKKLPNRIGDTKTTSPSGVAAAMVHLLEEYNRQKTAEFEDIIRFHYQFEKIHPFQDGNGRVGRLILFKECLRHSIMPFIIDEEHKLFYYRGLHEFDHLPGYLMDTCRSAQDRYAAMVHYFEGEADI